MEFTLLIILTILGVLYYIHDEIREKNSKFKKENNNSEVDFPIYFLKNIRQSITKETRVSRITEFTKWIGIY